MSFGHAVEQDSDSEELFVFLQFGFFRRLGAVECALAVSRCGHAGRHRNRDPVAPLSDVDQAVAALPGVAVLERHDEARATAARRTSKGISATHFLASASCRLKLVHGTAGVVWSSFCLVPYQRPVVAASPRRARAAAAAASTAADFGKDAPEPRREAAAGDVPVRREGPRAVVPLERWPVQARSRARRRRPARSRRLADAAAPSWTLALVVNARVRCRSRLARFEEARLFLRRRLLLVVVVLKLRALPRSRDDTATAGPPRPGRYGSSAVATDRRASSSSTVRASSFFETFGSRCL